MLNAGNAGRVSLQILTDFAPRTAYAFVAFTGFVEVSASAWWGFGLWRVMNRTASCEQTPAPKLVTIQSA